MDQTDLAYAGFCNALNCASPQFEIGVDWVFDQHWNINAAQCVGNFLHTERIHSGSRADPQYIHVKVKCIFNLLSGCYFNGGWKSGNLTCLLHPGKSLGSNSCEATCPGACLPNPSA